jgi:hypothetical protein
MKQSRTISDTKNARNHKRRNPNQQSESKTQTESKMSEKKQINPIIKDNLLTRSMYH